MALQDTTFGLFNNAAANAGQMYGTGLGMLGQGLQGMDQAGGGFGSMMGAIPGAMSTYSRMAGMAPSQLQAGQLSGTDLSGYMNPFQQSVIDSTMGELNRQELMQSNQMADQAQRVGAFGGDRMAVQQAENNRNFDMTRGQTLANLNSQNFMNAQGQATNDLNRNMQAQQGNQNMMAGMMQGGASGLASLGGQGASGLGQLGQGMAGMGQNQMQFGQNQMGNLANQGFNMGQQIQNNQMQMGGMQQNQLQNILNNIMGQTQSWQNYGDTGLQRYFGATQNPGGYGTSTTNGTVTGSTNPGVGGVIGGIGSIVGAFM